MDWKILDSSVIVAVAASIVSAAVFVFKKFGAKASENLLRGAVNITEEYAQATSGRLGVIKELREETVQLKKEIIEERQKSKEELELLHVTIKRLRDEAFSIQQKLAEQQAANIRLEAENEMLNNKLRDAQNRILQLELVIETLREEKREMQREISQQETFSDALQLAEKKLQLREDLLKELQQEVQRLESELNTYKKRLFTT